MDAIMEAIINLIETYPDAAQFSEWDWVFGVDNSGSMGKEGRWRIAGDALAALVGIADKYDQDGFDMHMMNAGFGAPEGTPGPSFTNIRTTSGQPAVARVISIFKEVYPNGITPFGGLLERIIPPYMEKLRSSANRKPLFVLVLTDGEGTDGPKPENIIKAASKELQDSGASPSQVVLFVVQIGADKKAAAYLDMLDNLEGVMDIVKTVKWSAISDNPTEGILKKMLEHMSDIKRR